MLSIQKALSRHVVCWQNSCDKINWWDLEMIHWSHHELLCFSIVYVRFIFFLKDNIIIVITWCFFLIFLFLAFIILYDSISLDAKRGFLQTAPNFFVTERNSPPKCALFTCRNRCNYLNIKKSLLTIHLNFKWRINFILSTAFDI